jgi:hypothetical protein
MSQLNLFYAELVRTQNSMLAIALADQMAPDRRDIIKEQLIAKIMAIVPGGVQAHESTGTQPKTVGTEGKPNSVAAGGG